MSRRGEVGNGARNITRCCLAAALCGAAGGGAHSHRAACNKRFEAPDPGDNVLSLNGVRLPDTCITTDGTHEVFIIGDWGGLYSGNPEQGPVPADHREKGVHKRDFVSGIDDRAQHAVRDRMVERAAEARPEYILNVGDNFYWGGVEMQCGLTRQNMSNFSWQWDIIFEDFYAGKGMDGVQWLGVLGNHDWGGFKYCNGWDQAILYTWKQPTNGKQMRWVTPALYWRSTVHYHDFSVDYFFLDTNIYDAYYPFTEMSHNICSYAFNPPEDEAKDCSAEGGPIDTFDCSKFFLTLWAEQTDWLHLQLSQSQADWQVVVTHFPPSFEREFWSNMTVDYGIDMFITGHLHRQEVWADSDDNFLAPTVVVVSGGGGGITSDYPPDVDGDDQYGYMRMSLFQDRLEVVNIRHTGAEGDRALAYQRPCYNCTEEHIARNLECYQNGLLERGRLGDSTTTTSQPSTSRSTQTSTSTTTGTSKRTTNAAQEHDQALVHVASEGKPTPNVSAPRFGVSPSPMVFLGSGDGGALVIRLVAVTCVVVVMGVCIFTGIFHGVKGSQDERGVLRKGPESQTRSITRCSNREGLEDGSPQLLIEEKAEINDKDFF